MVRRPVLRRTECAAHFAAGVGRRVNVDVGVAVAHKHKQRIEGHARVTNIRRRERTGKYATRIRLWRREEIDNDRSCRVKIAGSVNVKTSRCAGETLECHCVRNRRTDNGEDRAAITRRRVRRGPFVRAS